MQLTNSLFLFQTPCCQATVCGRCDLFAEVLDGDIGVDIPNVYANYVTADSFGYNGVRADRVFLELVAHHNKQNQADNNQQNFWFQALIMFQGHFSCPPTVGNLQFRHNLAVAQAAIRMHLSDKPTGVTRCCRMKYTISPKAPILGHDDEDDGCLLADIARRVVSSLLKTTIWDNSLPLFTGIHKWVEWTLARYGTDDAGEDRCEICLTADPVYQLRTADHKLCGHHYCAVFATVVGKKILLCVLQAGSHPHRRDGPCIDHAST